MKNSTRPVTCRAVAAALEQEAPLSLQEGYDNCGWQVGDPETICRGVLVCVDVTEARVAEAVSKGCNMIVSHHPLLFVGLKQIIGASVVQRAVIAALRAGVSVYALHTALDNAPAPWGVSQRMAAQLSLLDIVPLYTADNITGSGAVGNLPHPMNLREVAILIKNVYDVPVVRMTNHPDDAPVSRVALCGGSGASLADKAIAAGADIYITSDISYHKFVDFADDIILADIGHFDAEKITKQIIYEIITQKFPNFAVSISQREANPIKYFL